MQELNDKIRQFGDRVLQDYQTENMEALDGRRTSNYHTFFTSWYSTLSERMGQLDQQEARDWIEFRKEVKTNIEAERIWKASEAGQEQIELKYKLKSLEKIITACNRRLRVLEAESFNRM